ncbi:MAG: hypothetical protein LKI39_08080 [Bacteroides sp.]|jgi:hypothetical protein|nr:hypothetical protein [Bacteroides sp.]
MNSETIINVLRALEHEYGAERYKDGGREYIRRLSSKLLETTDEDKECLLKFFLNEIEFNYNNYRSVALLTIVGMKASEVAPALEKLYKKWRLLKDDYWNYTIVETMLLLKYNSSVYQSFFDYYISKDPDRAFPLVIYYCEIAPEQGITLLAQLCLIYVERKNDKDSLLKSKLSFLISYILEYHTFSFSTLVQKIISKNENRGNEFKQALIDELLDYGKRMQCEQQVKSEVELLNSRRI